MRPSIQRFIRDCAGAHPGALAVEDHALALFRWQRAHNPSYGAFCGDAEPTDIHGIPAVPVALFRSLPLCCGPAEHARLVFHTSGTTTGRPGKHRLVDSQTYDLASSSWFHARFPAAPLRCVSLIPSPAQAPHSSLSHMIQLLYPDAVWTTADSGLVDVERAWGSLAQQREPVFLAATALSLATLLDGPGRSELPSGSLLMSTGGFKGRSLSVDPLRLLGDAAARLGGRTALVGEYGMTELSSQLWSRPWSPVDGQDGRSDGPFYAPPWLVPIVVDPGSGDPLPQGQAGQIRFVDLANDHSVLAIETMDSGTILADGGLVLHGRLPGAAARGCSLSVEEALRASRARG